MQPENASQPIHLPLDWPDCLIEWTSLSSTDVKVADCNQAIRREELFHRIEGRIVVGDHGKGVGKGDQVDRLALVPVEVASVLFDAMDVIPSESLEAFSGNYSQQVFRSRHGLRSNNKPSRRGSHRSTQYTASKFLMGK